MIVSYDEHEVNNTFKFGVIYQKFRQVSNPRTILVEHIPACQRSASHKCKFGPAVNSVTCNTLCYSLIKHF